MKSQGLSVLFLLRVLAVAAVVVFCSAGGEAVFYQKNYVVEKDRGRDVLCDPYVVRENDYVIKILKQRGEIAHRDFPRFLEIFRRINPNVRDLDLIYPGQRILIPLRILEPGTLAGQASGRVSIPVITITNLPEALKRFSETYTVRYGDSVSRLISKRFGPYGSEGYRRGLKLFQRINPEIRDPDRILAGAKIRLPVPEIRDQPWYGDLFEHPDPRRRRLGGKTPGEAEESDAMPASVRVEWFSDLSVFARAAQIVGGKLLDEGRYFFPRRGMDDLCLDLSKTPVLELDDGRKLLFTKREWFSAADQLVLEQYWPNLEMMLLAGEPTLAGLLEKIIPLLDPDGYENRLVLEENGVSIVLRGRFIYDGPGGGKIYLNIISSPDMATPGPVSDYLETQNIRVRDWVQTPEMSGWVLSEGGDRNPSPGPLPVGRQEPEALVRLLAGMLGCGYEEDIEVCFPYAGFQVRAAANLLSLGEHKEILVDYGSMQGGAVAAIEKTGIRVVQILPGSSVEQMIEELKTVLPVSSTTDPIFWTAKRPRLYNISIQVPGFLLAPEESNGEKQLLLSRAPLADGLLRYFRQAGIAVARIH